MLLAPAREIGPAGPREVSNTFALVLGAPPKRSPREISTSLAALAITSDPGEAAPLSA